MITYQDLLDVFWQTNEAIVVPYTRQYLSIIFWHNEEQRNMAELSYKARLSDDPGTVETLIVPYSTFYLAEDYHQKYYLQNDSRLMQGFRDAGIRGMALVNSTAAARLNGFAGGNGDLKALNRDIDAYGLTESGKKRLKEIAEKGVYPVCGTGLALPG